MGRSGGSSGRSSGGSRSRSSGGRSSSSGRSRSGGFSSPSRGRGFGGHGGSHHYSPFHRNYHSHHRRPRYLGRGFSLAGVFMVIVAIIILFQIITAFGSPNSEGDVTKSSVVREPLPKGSVVETGYYTDDIGDWINNATKLTAGMKNFYKSTGVQPHLYITDNLDGNTNPSKADADAWMNRLYDELFEDEAHTLLVFYERNNQYNMWYLNGKQAKTVMDTEAMDILMDYVELYYYSDLTEDEMFSKAYDMTAERIMEVTKEPIPWYAYFFILVAVIVFIVILIKFWKAKKAQKNIEDANTRAILETPLEEIHHFPKNNNEC